MFRASASRTIGIADPRQEPEDEPAVSGWVEIPGPRSRTSFPFRSSRTRDRASAADRSFGRLRQGLGHEFVHRAGDHRQTALRRRHGDQAGAHLQGGLRGQGRRARSSPRIPRRRGRARRCPCGCPVSRPRRAAGRPPRSTSSTFRPGSSNSAGGMPIGATKSLPTNSSAGGRTWAILGAARVTVISARTAGPMIFAVSEESPEGMSTAALKARRRVDVLDDPGMEAFGRFRQPVPNRASTMRSARPAPSGCASSPPAKGPRRSGCPCSRRCSG